MSLRTKHRERGIVALRSQRQPCTCRTHESISPFQKCILLARLIRVSPVTQLRRPRSARSAQSRRRRLRSRRESRAYCGLIFGISENGRTSSKRSRARHSSVDTTEHSAPARSGTASTAGRTHQFSTIISAAGSRSRRWLISGAFLAGRRRSVATPQRSSVLGRRLILFENPAAAAPLSVEQRAALTRLPWFNLEHSVADWQRGDIDGAYALARTMIEALRKDRSAP